VKRNSLGGVDQVLNKGGDWPSGTCNYGLAFSDWTMVFIYNGGYYYVAEPGVPQDYEWHHYLVTAANGTPDVTFYIDGIKKQSALGDGSNPTVNLYSQSSADLYIGGTIYFSNNSQDDIRIYNRLLTEGEIQDVFYDGTVSVPENSLTNGIVISPNPTQGNFKVNLGASFENVRIQIADINGKTVKTEEYNEGQVFSFNLSEPDGIYYLRIESENRNATFLLIKN
jgi:hypothetical protein